MSSLIHLTRKKNLLAIANELKVNVDKINTQISLFVYDGIICNKEYGGTIVRSKLVDLDIPNTVKLTKGTISIELTLTQTHMKRIKRRKVFWHIHPFGEAKVSASDVAHFVELHKMGNEDMFITACLFNNRQDWIQVNYMFYYRDKLRSFTYYLKHRF